MEWTCHICLQEDGISEVDIDFLEYFDHLADIHEELPQGSTVKNWLCASTPSNSSNIPSDVITIDQASISSNNSESSTYSSEVTTTNDTSTSSNASSILKCLFCDIAFHNNIHHTMHMETHSINNHKKCTLWGFNFITEEAFAVHFYIINHHI
ncbi:unnamed protein product [Owenia fusiformis]|uniref:C2H2-type domain-containing protein n=1 Tax=Owenia fusiformis TaxID=6347 RepID=A0A8S4NBG2_OWEFU|nr:unnamed protein product [Owenia fusiformis]